MPQTTASCISAASITARQVVEALIERGRARTVIAQPRSTLVEECDPPQLTEPLQRCENPGFSQPISTFETMPGTMTKFRGPLPNTWYTMLKPSDVVAYSVSGTSTHEVLPIESRVDTARDGAEGRAGRSAAR